VRRVDRKTGRRRRRRRRMVEVLIIQEIP